MRVTHCPNCLGGGRISFTGAPSVSDWTSVVCDECEGTGHIIEVESKPVPSEPTIDQAVNVQAVVNPVDHLLCSGFDETCYDGDPCPDCDLRNG